MSKIQVITLVKRQKQALKKTKTKNFESFSTPKIVDQPKTKRAKKKKELKTNRESIITNLEASYIDPIRKIKLKAYDLAVINERKKFRNIEPKPDRMNNRAVDYMIPHLKLLNFLLENFSEHYRKKIWESPQFRSLFEKYLGIAEYTNVKLSTQEKQERLTLASQQLMDSLTVIEDNLPLTFKEVLRDTGKPYFKLIKAISASTRKGIRITDRMIR